MRYQSVINDVAKIVEAACYSKNNVFGSNIWETHILETIKWSEALALLNNAERDIVILSALLHDYAGIINPVHYHDHHLESAKLAKSLLSQLAYPTDRIKAVQACIKTHRASQTLKPKSIEAQCLANADALAHILRYDALLQYAQRERHLTYHESIKFVSNKIHRSWLKIEPKVQAMFIKHYRFALSQLQSVA